VAKTIDRETIAAIHGIILPYVRVTPVLEVDAGDLGLSAFRLVLKLEQLQCSGSFKARGAFANLLTRKIPAAGVVAASGGNHGVAVAYAAQRLGVRARIFVPTVASPVKIARIRESAAELVIGGDRYADAFAASERVWRKRVPCPCTPSIRWRRSSDKARSPWNSPCRLPTWTRSWSRSAEAG